MMRPIFYRLMKEWSIKNLERLSANRYAVRFNYPYKGTADGHTTALRAQFPPSLYAGMELEVSQRYFGKNKKAPPRAIIDITRALKAALASV